MAKMIDTLKAAIEAEKEKLLAELPQAVEPQLSAIRREIEARELLLARRSTAPTPHDWRHPSKTAHIWSDLDGRSV